MLQYSKNAILVLSEMILFLFHNSPFKFAGKGILFKFIYPNIILIKNNYAHFQAVTK
jgi:hypothetical protein